MSNSDPSMRALRSLRILLAYGAAKANGSTGRSLSDQEMAANLDAIGDPTALLTTQDSFLAAMATLEFNASAQRLARSGQGPAMPFDQYLQQYVAAAKAGQPIPQLGTPNNSALGQSPQPGAATPEAPTGGGVGSPTPGTVEDGFRFMGGDPSNPGSWQRVQ